jgi:glutathione synthase/RimK-type ligase-like ATP-grasp enzyme
MLRVAFLALADRTKFVCDDELAIPALARLGIHAEEIPWRQPDVDWRAFDGVVVRSTWDYQRDVDAFLDLLARIEELGVPLANPASVVRWNARKTYLRELEARGVPIVPTRWGDDMSLETLRRMPDELGVEECVLKPVVSANADDTYRVSNRLEDADAARIVSRFAGRAWMMQPFLRRVVEEGEHSLVYFDGAYSHAIVKVPRAGDFRVQEEHGGVHALASPEPALRDAADRVLASVGSVLLQARVDLVRLDDGTPVLMELEAIEPSLYFRLDPLAPSRFAGAVERWLRTPRASVTPRAGAGARET